MKIMGQNEEFMCADGKFFALDDFDTAGKAIWRQIERYLPASTGCYQEPLEATMDRWLSGLQDGTLEWKWAIGSTGGQLTARYQVRESDGELVSLLTLSGGMKKA